MIRPASAASRCAPTLLLLMVALMATLSGCSPSRSLEAMRVLRDIEAGAGPSALKEATPAPARSAIVFEVDGRSREADVYTPGEPALAGMVLVPGLTPRGRNDARIVDFANTLARARFEVIVPDLVNMRALQVSVDDALPIADAARWLETRGEGWPVGISAVSFAVGPGVVALFQPEASGVDFFVSIGGYHDLEALITYITTGSFREEPGAPWSFRPPKAYGKWIFVLTNAGRVADPEDREALFDIARRKLDDKDADVSDLVATLGPDGEAVYALITNTDPDRVPTLMGGLPPEVRDEAMALDLSRRDLAPLQVDFILVHDRGDRIIPATHSRDLARALAPGRGDVYLVDGLDHAEVKSLGTGDALVLLEAVYSILRMRDEGRPAMG